MKWKRGHRSKNVIDSRGKSGGRGGLGGKLGIGGTLIALLVAAVLGRDYLGVGSGSGSSASQSTSEGDRDYSNVDTELVSFVSFVLDDVQASWQQQFARADGTYKDATMELFTDRVNSACGMSTSATGPFYCPPDHRVFIDLGFFQALSDHLKAPGDFAQAYVIAHEIGHHVQNLLGKEDWFRREQRKDPSSKNDLSIRFELQADCYAGVWAHSTKKRDLLERGDIDEGLGAASAIGDDRLQKMGSGQVNKETWTHGSSGQRVKWFKRGMQRGDMNACDTFSVSKP
jgi:hypothetical protein